jgi:hypothetical protein
LLRDGVTLHSTLELLIENVECKLSLEVEPLFCTIALYDIEKQIKISENFHFVLHSDLLPEHMVWCHSMMSYYLTYHRNQFVTHFLGDVFSTHQFMGTSFT